MLPFPGIYYPPEDSIMHELFGDEVPGMILKVEPERVVIRIEFEPRLDHEEPHTVVVYAPHKRVRIGNDGNR